MLMCGERCWELGFEFYVITVTQHFQSCRRGGLSVAVLCSPLDGPVGAWEGRGSRSELWLLLFLSLTTSQCHGHLCLCALSQMQRWKWLKRVLPKAGEASSLVPPSLGNVSPGVTPRHRSEAGPAAFLSGFYLASFGA